ncbi:AAA family ATPase [Kutzneria sp. CA-103260]|uniref:AAA family ATPase n=1 Tax=Kutzneria sp. CA-103260 TaxID=2802641 RepID=UPI001BACAADD|nr:AAA family ATPase [Kutzneria sp. CA-103260]QUQ67108.1 AAA domain (Cdc48 subfamily) [Kutzneria sp. CA-103260]
MLFENGLLSTVGLEPRTEAIVLAAVDRRTAPVRPSDFLAAALSASDRQLLATITMALSPDAEIDHVRQIITVHNPPGSAREEFDGQRDRFSAAALRAMDEFDAARARDQAAGSELELLMLSVMRHLEIRVPILDTETVERVLREHIALASAPPATLFEGASGRLRSEMFTEAAWVVLQNACVRAAELGYDRVLPPHCLLALLAETEGLAERLVRLQVPAELGPSRVAEAVANALRISERAASPLQLRQEDLGDATVALLQDAHRLSQVWGVDRVGPQHLLGALLEDPPARLVLILEREPLRLNLATARRQLEQFLRDGQGKPPPEVPFRIPGDLLPSEDLTHTARTKGIPVAPHLDAPVELMTRALFRKSGNHVLITGHAGVGRTALVRELARRAATGKIQFLRHKRFVWADGRDVAPADSGRKLAAVFSHVAGRTDLVLCLDGLGQLLRGESGADHRMQLRAALTQGQVQLIGVLDATDYEDLFAGDQAVRSLVTRVELREPDREIALDMVDRVASGLAEEFGLEIEPKAVERAVGLCADYILNERLPRKAVAVLRRACEDLDFERTVMDGERQRVTTEDVITVVARLSGVPEGQLSGIDPAAGEDYEKALGAEVVGQEHAVKAVAEELRLIKFGLRAGSVLFFAGLTGTGKSELAKTLARFYSASKKLQVYTMGNFLEGHSVSGIIGVPAGYVGHERGGRLINDLNADPYCVFLLDEAEKAHPDVWKPFLNLFDEGWIEDQRGVRAHADRAIFILTSNAGSDKIAQLHREGATPAGVERAVRDHLPTMRHHHSREVVFPPEFLARIQRIIVFNPLDRAAMGGITRKVLEQRQRFWATRDKQLEVPETLVEHIADLADRRNRDANGQEGGRIVKKLIAEWVEDPIVRAATRDQRAYQTCDRIELVHRGQDVDVVFTSAVDSGRHG